MGGRVAVLLDRVAGLMRPASAARPRRHAAGRCTLWARLRYRDAACLADLLARLAGAGAVLELRLRADGVPRLFAGVEDGGWMAALAGMAQEFGADLDHGAEPPTPLGQPFVPGNWNARGAGSGDADALILPPGEMYISGAQASMEDTAGAGAAVAVPTPMLGLSAVPDLPFAPACPPGAVWRLGETGVGAPAGLLPGAPGSCSSLLVAFALEALGEARGTLIVDGTGGRLAGAVREHSCAQALLASGRLVELSIAQAAVRGFNPLARTALGGDASLWRWLWWWGGMGVTDRGLISATYARGLHGLRAVAAAWAALPSAWIAARAVRELMGCAEVAAWLSGDFDVAGHLARGGHLLVTCQGARGPRLQALRGLLALGAEAPGARVLSAGVRWPGDCTALLRRLDALCAGRYWTHTIFARCPGEVAAEAARRFANIALFEYLTHLPETPESFGLVHGGADEFWIVRGSRSPRGPRAASETAAWPPMPEALYEAESARLHEEQAGLLAALASRGAEPADAGDPAADPAEAQAAASAGQPAAAVDTASAVERACAPFHQGTPVGVPVRSGDPPTLRRPTLLEAYGASRQESLAHIRLRLRALATGVAPLGAHDVPVMETKHTRSEG